MSKSRRKRAAVGTAVIALAALGGAAVHAGFVEVNEIRAEPVAAAPSDIASPPAHAAAVDLSNAFADLAAASTPAVVRIEVEIPAEQMGEGRVPDIPDEFRRFFNFQAPGSDGELGRPQPRFGGGTGFLISDDGYIVTNDHVAGDADQITVTLQDNRSFAAELVGTDPTTDVAVVKIDARDLPYLQWGSSTDLRVGELVVAVGNPGYGGGEQLDYTVTSGIVSGKGRPLQLLSRGLADDPRYGPQLAGYAIENFIQTDAVINPGNSGGPLLDLDGRVVGVNSAIATTDGHYQGYGFAIPSDLVRKVATDLIDHGSVRRAWLGVQVTAVRPEDAEAFHLPGVRGALVQAVTEKSPADEAGLRMGDVIVAVDGREIDNGGSLQEVVATLSQGERVSIDLYRDGHERTVEVRLGTAPVAGERPNPAKAGRDDATAGRNLGLELSTLDQQTARRLGYGEAGGVVVSGVDPAGPAARSGVTPGSKLVSIDRHEVKSIGEAAERLTGIESGQVVTLILENPSGQQRIANVRAR